MSINNAKNLTLYNSITTVKRPKSFAFLSQFEEQIPLVRFDPKIGIVNV